MVLFPARSKFSGIFRIFNDLFKLDLLLYLTRNPQEELCVIIAIIQVMYTRSVQGCSIKIINGRGSMSEEVGCQLLRLWQKLWLRFEDLNYSPLLRLWQKLWLGFEDLNYSPLLRLWQKLWLKFEDLNLCVNCPIICVLVVYILP